LAYREQNRSGTGARRALRLGVFVVLAVVGGFTLGWFTAYSSALPYPWFEWGGGRAARDSEADLRPPGAPPGLYSRSRSDDGASGVTINEADAVFPGVNLIVSGHAPEALLMDMEGRALHRWAKAFADVWPEDERAADENGAHYWSHATPGPDGTLLAIYDGLGLVKLDSDSGLVWSYRGRVHDAICPTEDGAFCTLERVDVSPDGEGGLAGGTADVITFLSAEGEVVRRIPLLEALGNSPYAPLLKREPAGGALLRANAVRPLGDALSNESPAFAAGNLVVSLPDIQAVAVVDSETEEVVWALAGLWRSMSGPVLLENGNMLIFVDDVGGHESDRTASEVRELDPFTQQTVWAYPGDATRPLQSASGGACQRLGNGNTLISESDGGRAIEVTPAGDIVWEFLNPHKAGSDGELVAAIPELLRLPASFGSGWVGEGE